MFNDRDIELMNLSYFNVIRACESMYEIQSICTGYYWAIVPLEMKSRETYYMLLHKYNEYDNYHYQIEFGTVLDVVLDIINHDDYKLHRRNTLFEEVIEQYTWCLWFVDNKKDIQNN